MPDEPAIHVANLEYRYPSGPVALDGVNFVVQPGEVVGLVGPNGAGKTSLFLCLSGVLTPTQGSVRVAGLDVLQPAGRRSLPQKLGIVFQHSDDQLFNASVRDEVAFGPLNLGMSPREAETRVAEALGRVDLSGLEERVPYHLSGGEKKRVALAGVLAMRPEVLLLDEPSSHLDPRGRRELIRLIQLLEGAKLVAAHDLELIVATCSRVLVLDRGQLVASGPTADLLRDANLMERHGLEVPHSLTHPHRHVGRTDA